MRKRSPEFQETLEALRELRQRIRREIERSKAIIAESQRLFDFLNRANPRQPRTQPKQVRRNPSETIH
jgi:hypothetical protein